MTSPRTTALPAPPRFSKKILSLFIRNQCERQARLYMYPDAGRPTGLPTRQQNRSGRGLVGAAGDDWQDKKVAEVSTIFGASNVIVAPPAHGQIRPQPTLLGPVLGSLRPYMFVVEAEFDIEHDFKALYGLHGVRDEFGNEVEVGAFRPDIIRVGPPRKSSPDAAGLEVNPEGKLVTIGEHDDRLQLRIIDVKLASEPGAYYFAEVVYYSVGLALWLKTQPDGHRFVVTADASVWPGSYEKSALATKYQAGLTGVMATPQQLMAALEEDLEPAEFRVYLPRLNRFLRGELPQLLRTPWNALEWHPSFRCQTCEFLGYAWPGSTTHRPDHCWQIAQAGDMHVRVPGMTAVTAKFVAAKATTVPALAALAPSDPVFDGSSALQLKRKILPARAEALRTGVSFGIPDTGQSAAQPSYANLDLYVFLDYDPSSAITACIALRGNWREERPYGSTDPTPHHTLQWNEDFMVGAPTVASEAPKFLDFLRKVHDIIEQVRIEDAKHTDVSSSYQIYVWDDAQYRHLTRLMGRHLHAILADSKLRGLAWLFPPEELLPEPDHASRMSPISVVSTTVENHVAVPVPHHYTLYEVAQHWRPSWALAPVWADAFYREPLTNLIPAERLYEFWNQVGKWVTTGTTIQKTTQAKALALSFVVGRLREVTSGVTLAKSTAPRLPIVRQPGKLAEDANLWHQHTMLNGKLQEMEIERTYALPPAEREAKFRAAHLTRRLTGAAETAALAKLNAQSGLSLVSAPKLLVYELSPRSRDVRFKEGEFTLALSPRGHDLFLNQKAETILPGSGWRSVKSLSLTGVTLRAIDRENLLVALEADPRSKIVELQRGRHLSFAQDMMLDTTHLDLLTSKVEMSLEAIGVPKGYVPLSSQSGAAVARPPKPSGRGKKANPGHDFLHNAKATEAVGVSRNLIPLEASLRAAGATLNSSQWDAWRTALTRRLTLIWGPPGTGKSETLRAIIISAVEDAQAQGKALRVLITANNYTAIDNVLLKLERILGGRLGVSLYRVQSSKRPVPPVLASYPHLNNMLLNKADPSAGILHLQQQLTDLGGTSAKPKVVIVGMPNQQAHNLAVALAPDPVTGVPKKASYGATLKPWFDLAIIDEASQLDVAGSTLIFGKMAPGSICILAGDHLQLPPIHQADPPERLDKMVGSVYDFMFHTHGIQHQPLLVSYRSNAQIVDFVRQADYPTALASHSPNLELNLLSPFPTIQPAGWPADLAFSPAWAKILRSDRPVTCIIYEDGTSGQVNDFEAQTVAALLRSLYGHVGAPKGRLDPGKLPLPDPTTPYAKKGFWEQAVGVVAPHRAQGSKIIDRLHKAFAGTGTTRGDIQEAVDTVERYQGQERDVIIASIGMGDPDAIASEDEFLFNLNRFNVLVSRAATKVVVFVTRSLLDHLANDQDVIRDSRLIKDFAETFCDKEMTLQLPYYDELGALQHKDVTLRYR